MGAADELLGLLVAIALLAQLARRLDVPYPIVLVVGGAAIGFIPEVPVLDPNPDLVLLVFLPPLLLAAAWGADLRSLRRHLAPVVLLAVGLVMATAAAVALVAHLVVGLPLAVAVVLGAIVAPTDPVAAEAVFRRLGVPERVSTVVSGESLLNDASAIVLYQVAVTAAVSGDLSTGEAVLEFLVEGPGGALVGLAGGWIALRIWRTLGDASVFIVVTLVTPYAIFLAADKLGLSGVLAVVAAGFYLSWHAVDLGSARLRVQALSFWAVLIFLLNALLFVIVGLAFAGVLDALGDVPWPELLGWGAAVAGTVVAVRIGWFAASPLVGRGLAALLRGGSGGADRAWPERLVMSWSGMRGGVSLALALAVPLAAVEAGSGERELLIFLTFAVILVTLVLQGLTLPGLVLRLGLTGGDAREHEVVAARLAAARAGLQRLDELAGAGRVPVADEDRHRRVYERRIETLEELSGERLRTFDEQRRGWRRELVAAERSALRSLRDRGEISPEVLRAVQRELDLEETRLGG